MTGSASAAFGIWKSSRTLLRGTRYGKLWLRCIHLVLGIKKWALQEGLVSDRPEVKIFSGGDWLLFVGEHSNLFLTMTPQGSSLGNISLDDATYTEENESISGFWGFCITRSYWVLRTQALRSNTMAFQATRLMERRATLWLRSASECIFCCLFSKSELLLVFSFTWRCMGQDELAVFFGVLVRRYTSITAERVTFNEVKQPWYEVEKSPDAKISMQR